MNEDIKTHSSLDGVPHARAKVSECHQCLRRPGAPRRATKAPHLLDDGRRALICMVNNCRSRLRQCTFLFSAHGSLEIALRTDGGVALSHGCKVTLDCRSKGRRCVKVCAEVQMEV